MNIYDEIRLNQTEYNAKNSATWFMQNVRNFAAQKNIGPMKMLGDNTKLQRHNPEIGSMFMFTYSPIHRDTLPFYDKFPLVLPFSYNAEYMTGINLHYMHPKVRLKLLDKLLETVTDDKLSAKTKMRLNWKLLSRVSKFPEVTGCVKQYHMGHVKSMFLKVAPKDWAMAIFLPLERFVGATSNTVWKLNKIKAS